MHQPLISLITVVFNGEKVIAETLRSAVAQTYKDIELVIVDGGSKDKTVEIAKQFSSHIGTLVSEPDKGIYDAMNKAVQLAKGEWVYFLNAGDSFYDNRVLEDIFSSRDFESYDFIYAKVQTINEPTGVDYVTGQPVHMKDFYFTYPICHQATFTRRRAFLEIGLFDVSLRLTADTEWFTRLFKDRQRRTLFIDRIVAYYDIQGVSYHKRMQGYKEFLKYTPRYFPFAVNVYNRIMYPMIWMKVKLIRLFTGTALFSYYRKLKFNKSR
jgi:glycosyltransferase involved in cell wall biosynthesis